MRVTRRKFLKKAGAGAGALLLPQIMLRDAWTQARPIQLGGTQPLTGPFADTGVWVERGYKFWGEKVNREGGLLGRPVEVTILDDASSVDRAVSLLERLITVDRVDLILGGYPGTSAAAQMALAERYRKVYISMGGHMASFRRGFKFSFGGPPLMGQWWYEGVWRWLANIPQGQRPARAAAITVNNAVGMAVRESMTDGLKRLGIPMVMDELYDLPLPSAEPLVSRARGAGADMFLANGFFPDGVLTIRAMKALDYNPKLILQGVGSIIPEWVTQLGPDGDYVVSGTAIHHKLPFPGIAELNKAAQERFNLPHAPLYFLFGYCWAQVLQQAVEATKSLSHAVLVRYMREGTFKTVAGEMKFDERGLPAPYEYTTQVINGAVELIWPPGRRSAQAVYPKPPWRR